MRSDTEAAIRLQALVALYGSRLISMALEAEEKADIYQEIRRLLKIICGKEAS